MTIAELIAELTGLVASGKITGAERVDMEGCDCVQVCYGCEPQGDGTVLLVAGRVAHGCGFTGAGQIRVQARDRGCV